MAEPVEIEVGPVAVMTPPARALSPIDPSVIVLTVSRLVPFRVTSDGAPLATIPGEVAPVVVTVPAPKVTLPPPSACTPAAVAPLVVIEATPPILIVDTAVLGAGATPEA